ncbi:MAG TPA: hypothetical protein VJ729_14255 [Nitrososphaeraceae archaeon]|nr:hypothetical protein [Nitrososphaeraceae archaeon]
MTTENLTLNINVVEYGRYIHNETIGTLAVEHTEGRLEYSFPNATNFNNHFIALSKD